MPLTGLRARADDTTSLPRFVVPLLDLTARSDEQLERTRVFRGVAIVLWLTLFTIGLIGALELQAWPVFQMLSFAAIVAGLVNAILSIGGLFRVLAERRARAAQRRAFLANPEPSKWDER